MFKLKHHLLLLNIFVFLV
ncbi:SVM family protein [Candidatus Phytoplasma fraxini]|uniref:SVM family protein n=1 Tax=Ash yellows phytoplasma TaxID=35780 RepID=A0ABZ2U7S2_ASHYP